MKIGDLVAAAAKALGVQPVDEASEARFASLVHWAYGTSCGGYPVLGPD